MWDSLSDQEQIWLTEAMHLATEFQKKLWAESTQMSLEKVKEAGVTVLTADKALFQESVEPIFNEMKGSDLEPLINEIKALGDTNE
jgi:TRAP-type C4-dicarboxylate transport system substrate-binding protein